MDCEEHSHVGFSDRDENSQVLEEDREFDRENSQSVDDRVDIDILWSSQLSMRALLKLNSNIKQV